MTVGEKGSNLWRIFFLAIRVFSLLGVTEGEITMDVSSGVSGQASFEGEACLGSGSLATIDCDNRPVASSSTVDRGPSTLGRRLDLGGDDDSSTDSLRFFGVVGGSEDPVFAAPRSMEDHEPPATLRPMSRVSKLILVLGRLLLAEPEGVSIDAWLGCSAESVLRLTFRAEERPKGFLAPLPDVGLETARLRSWRPRHGEENTSL